MENRIKVMVFEPLKEPYIENIKNVPEVYKSIVEGETEEVRLDEKTLLICNSEGKEKELVPNRTIGNDIICGTFFLAADTGSDKRRTFKRRVIGRHLIQITRGSEIQNYSSCSTISIFGSKFRKNCERKRRKQISY